MIINNSEQIGIELIIELIGKLDDLPIMIGFQFIKIDLTLTIYSVLIINKFNDLRSVKHLHIVAFIPFLVYFECAVLSHFMAV